MNKNAIAIKLILFVHLNSQIRNPAVPGTF
jgi:hypothetical protein